MLGTFIFEPSERSEVYVVNVYGDQKICVVNAEISLFIYLKAHLKIEITLLSDCVALTLKLIIITNWSHVTCINVRYACIAFLIHHSVLIVMC